ncbi:MAG: hypothetical protein RL519_1513 [Pseudomonadota bacterium]|jgi:hypothetical protein
MTGWAGIDPAAWAGSANAIMTGLLRNSVQALAEEASKTIPNGGRVPVKTGDLARSVVVSLTPPTVKDGPFTGDITTGIAGIQPGDTIYLGWQARYSARQNFGFVGEDSLGRTYAQSGFGFAEAAAAKWDSIVMAEAARLGGR